MNIIGCLDVPTRGHYLLDGVNVRETSTSSNLRVRNRKIGFIFQLQPASPNDALANVELPLAYAGVPPKERQSERSQRSGRGLGDTCNHPNQLSGGQQQRVAVAGPS